MRLLQVINTLQMGGAEKLITELVPRILNDGHDVDVLVFDGKSTPFMNKLIENKVHVISLSQGPGSPYSPKYFFKLIPILKQYDIVHSHTTPAQLFCSLAKPFCKRTALITTEHSTYNHRRGKWYFRIIDKCIYKPYTKIICIGKMAKENLEDQVGNLGEKVIVIENGIDLNIYDKAIPIPRDRIQCVKEDFVLTMVGRFTDAKDQRTIINSLSFLPKHIKLVLVGDGPHKDVMYQLAENLGVLDRVVFLGLRDDVPSILKASDVVILSSHWEGFGLAAVEGMAAYKPVIASNVPGLREVVEGAGLLFKVGDATTLSQLILKLMDDDVFYNKIATQSLERAHKYDINIVAQRYEHVYRDVNDQRNGIR